MRIFFDQECLLHQPPYEILSGKLRTYYDSPQRLLQIFQALEGHDIFQIETTDRSIDVRKHALEVHSEDYFEHLESAFRIWTEGGGDPKVQTGSLVVPMVILAYWHQDPLFPEAFPSPKFAPHFTATRPPPSLAGKAGESVQFFDSPTPQKLRPDV